jgi:uncharacterized membrane protein
MDNKSAAFGGTCLNTTDANGQCCGDNGPPYYDPNTCNFYYIQFQNAPSSSFSSSPYAGYYDASSSLKKGFKSFAVSSYSGTVGSETVYFTCTTCASTTEQNIIDGGAYFGDSAFAGIKEADGTLWTWGYNASGQLGNNSTVRTKSPVQLGSNSWKMVSGGYLGFAAIRSDDTLWTWGENSFGQLGDNSTLNRSSPVQVAGSWKYVASGYYTTIGIKSDDTLWTWGYNASGQLGDNSTVSRSSPVQVSGGGSWKYVFSGIFTTHAIKTNGTMYGWGNNPSPYYPVGDGSIVNRSAPVQIGTSFSDWTHVRNNGNNGGHYAIRSNGTAYAWGYVPYGLSSAIYSLPTQIGSATNHASCSLGYHFSYNPFIGGEGCEPFITTDGNVIAYNSTTSAQVSKYSGGGATQLIVDASANGTNVNNNVFLMKYIE